MLKKNNRGLVAILAVLAVAGIALPLLAKVPMPTPKQVMEVKSKSLLAPVSGYMINADEALKDRVLGDPKAPVTIIEYASLTCGHCAHFATKVLPEVKKRLIDTGKAKLIYRDFPLDNTALKAAMMARCVADDKYFSLIEVLFNSQERWARAKDPMQALEQIGALAGMDKGFFNACTSSEALETALLTNLQKAQAKYDLKATPTFIINDGAEIISGGQDADAFETAVNKLIKGK